MYEKGLRPTIWGKEIILYCDQNIYRSVSIVYIVDFKKIISGRFLPIQLYKLAIAGLNYGTDTVKE